MYVIQKVSSSVYSLVSYSQTFASGGSISSSDESVNMTSYNSQSLSPNVIINSEYGVDNSQIKITELVMGLNYSLPLPMSCSDTDRITMEVIYSDLGSDSYFVYSKRNQ